MYYGTIIEESLEDKEVLRDVEITKTEVEQVTEEHKTPWIKQWTLHSVEIADGAAAQTAERISKSLDHKHNWYADYKNDKTHFIIFRDKIFKINTHSEEQYAVAKKYGISLGIPEYQVDFHSTKWER